ncbi:DUF3244 domain-containing protein [Runella sp.]|uniref:DUF3244 domain-containing protein n=1 Tax=Runella sp. TaxID=1960881 RepID=UPI003D122ED8
MKTIITSLVCALALSTTVAFAHPTDEKSKDNRPVPTFEASTYVSADASLRVAIKKNSPERVYVTLRNAEGVVLFSETIGKKEMTYAAKFDVKDLTDGAYQLEITSGKEHVVKKLNLTSQKVETQRVVTVL